MRISLISNKWALISAIVLLSATGVSLKAQFNVKVGYNLGLASPDINNEILDTFNFFQSMNFDEFNEVPPLRIISGVTVGLRHKFSFGALTLDWENLNRSLSFLGNTQLPLPARPISETFEVTYTFNMIMAGVEFDYGKIAIGSSIGRNFVSITQETQTGDDSSLFTFGTGSRSQTFARLHLSIKLTGSKLVGFSVSPYVQIPITKVDLTPVASKLGVSRTEADESFPLIGISFLFYNGPQN